MSRKIIGLGHKAGVGKTTVAKHLQDRHGFKILSFASPLRDVVKTVFGLTVAEAYGQELKHVELPYWTSKLGFTATPRSLMQFIGTDVFRRSVHHHVWVYAMERRLEEVKGPVVIDDVRFYNEVVMLERAKAALWKIKRDVDGGLDPHESETALNDYRHWLNYVSNKGSLEQLYASVDRLMLVGRGD